MSLFKIYKGKAENLSSQPLVEGHAYFTPDDGGFYIDAIKDDKLKEVKQLETPLTETFVTTRVNNKFDILKGDARSSQAAQLTDPANIGMSDKIKTFMSKIK